MRLSRGPLVALLGLAFLAGLVGVFVAAPSAEGRVPRRAPGPQRAAEWGVWKVHAGHITSLDELAAELPSFAHRGRPHGAPPRPVPDHRHRAYKPVLYLYSAETCGPTPIHVHVGLRVGGSTLYYPYATMRDHGLSFDGVLYPVQFAPNCRTPPTPPAAPPGHFWNDLRAVPASIFHSSSSEAERFIFYDALTDLRSPFQFYGAGDHASVGIRRGRHGEPNITDTVFAVHGGMFHRVVPAGQNPTRLASGDAHPMSMLEDELRTQLLARGLTPPEAQSLLATWHPDLIEAGSDRRIYFVDRADYDAMLPIQITPRPRELVRVGLVIDLP